MRPEAVTGGAAVGAIGLDRVQVGSAAKQRVTHRIRLGPRERAHRVHQPTPRTTHPPPSRRSRAGGRPGRSADASARATGAPADAGRSHAAARRVHEHPIERPQDRRRRRVVHEEPRVQPEPLPRRGDQTDAVLGRSAASTRPVGPDQLGGVQRLAAGSRTGVVRAVAAFGSSTRTTNAEALILDGPSPLVEARRRPAPRREARCSPDQRVPTTGIEARAPKSRQGTGDPRAPPRTRRDNVAFVADAVAASSASDPTSASSSSTAQGVIPVRTAIASVSFPAAGTVARRQAVARPR